MSARARDGTGLTELARMAIPICRPAQGQRAENTATAGKAAENYGRLPVR